MSKHRCCLNCGEEISFLKNIFFNKCCSYECDVEYGRKKKREDREQWEKNRIERSIKLMNESPYTHYKPKVVEHEDNEEDYSEAYPIMDNSSSGGASSMDSVNEFYDYTITDDNDNDDYNY